MHVYVSICKQWKKENYDAEGIRVWKNSEEEKEK